VPGELDWERLAEAFAAIADLPADQQAAALRQCADPALRERLADMLAADQATAHPLDADIATTARALIGGAPDAPRRIGPYHLDRLLGEGSSAVVYLATRPDLDHQVAVKILRDAWLSPARRDRFLLEQRTLAQLNHPAIARFHDADSFAEGTPWLAMEYVPGVPITEYADRLQLDTRARLRLIRAVAEAMQHAHQRAVIHRDLKPSNILVTEDGTVKVVDFGIAKHLQDTGDPDPTRTGLRFMTPAYAAPEQLARRDAGTYTDVYALGAVAYQLVTGRLPQDVADKSPEELIAAIERGPAPASLKLGADLDVLLATALHADPARRYPGMGDMIEDIDHLLAGEPLRARPDSFGYRTGKFLRRHTGVVAAGVGVLLLLIGLVTFYTVRLRASRDTALAEAARAQRVQNFMQSLFEGGDNSAAPADTLRVLTLVDRGLQEVRSLTGDPKVRSELLLTLGSLYQKLGRLDRADSLFEASLAERRALAKGGSPEVADALLFLGLLRMDQAKLEDAERLVREAIGMDSATRPAGHVAHAAARTAMGRVQEAKGDYPAAIATLVDAMRLHAVADSGSAAYWATVAELANSQFYAGNYDAADSLNILVLAVDRERRGPGHPAVAEDLINLGATEFERGKYPEAEKYFREALAINRNWYGTDHYETAASLTMLGRALIRASRWEEAAGSLAEALAIRERVFGPSHPNVASTLNELGTVALRRERWDEAEKYYQRATDIYRSTYNGKHYLIGIGLSNLGSVGMGRGDNAAAERYLREALLRFQETLAPDHSNIGIVKTKLGRALLRQLKYGEAEAESLAGYEILSRQATPALNFIKNARADLVVAYTALGRPADAARFKDP
jgi:serine/threonine-protein kinase